MVRACLYTTAISQLETIKVYAVCTSSYTKQWRSTPLSQEKLDVEVLCKENTLLPASAEHPEEFEAFSGAVASAAISSGRYCYQLLPVYTMLDFDNGFPFWGIILCMWVGCGSNSGWVRGCSQCQSQIFHQTLSVSFDHSDLSFLLI